MQHHTIAQSAGKNSHDAWYVVLASLYVVTASTISTQCSYALRPGCQHVSKALAICLHESLECAESLAHNEERCTLLLALALPGRIQLSRPRKSRLGPSTLGSDTDGNQGAVVSIRDRGTRENSLSCLCSAIKVITSYPLV